MKVVETQHRLNRHKRLVKDVKVSYIRSYIPCGFKCCTESGLIPTDEFVKTSFFATRLNIFENSVKMLRKNSENYLKIMQGESAIHDYSGLTAAQIDIIFKDLASSEFLVNQRLDTITPNEPMEADLQCNSNTTLLDCKSSENFASNALEQDISANYGSKIVFLPTSEVLKNYSTLFLADRLKVILISSALKQGSRRADIIENNFVFHNDFFKPTYLSKEEVRAFNDCPVVQNNDILFLTDQDCHLNPPKAGQCSKSKIFENIGDIFTNREIASNRQQILGMLTAFNYVNNFSAYEKEDFCTIEEFLKFEKCLNFYLDHTESLFFIITMSNVSLVPFLFDLKNGSAINDLLVKSKKEETDFIDYYTSEQISIGKQEGRVFRGTLYVNAHNCFSGIVHAKFRGKNIQIKIVGKKDINRAFNLDTVHVEVKKKEANDLIEDDCEYIPAQYSVSLDSNGNIASDYPNHTATNLSSPALIGLNDHAPIQTVHYPIGSAGQYEADKEAQFCTSPSNDTEIYGRVVGVTKRSKTPIIATLIQSNGSFSIVRPLDRKLPKFRIQTTQADKLINKRILCKFSHWDIDSNYPFAVYIRKMGALGDLEAEVESIKVSHGIDYQNYKKDEFLDDVIYSMNREFIHSYSSHPKNIESRQSQSVNNLPDSGGSMVDFEAVSPAGMRDSTSTQSIVQANAKTDVNLILANKRAKQCRSIVDSQNTPTEAFPDPVTKIQKLESSVIQNQFGISSDLTAKERQILDLYKTVLESEQKYRLDCRDLPVVSIDPVGCTDIDDAVSLVDNGSILEIGVHIADVTFFVQPETGLDLEARNRGTTVYLTDRRYDMLPDILSSNLCSLRENEDRLAFSVFWEIDKQKLICGNILDDLFDLTPNNRLSQNHQSISYRGISEDMSHVVPNKSSNNRLPQNHPSIFDRGISEDMSHVVPNKSSNNHLPKNHPSISYRGISEDMSHVVPNKSSNNHLPQNHPSISNRGISEDVSNFSAEKIAKDISARNFGKKILNVLEFSKDSPVQRVYIAKTIIKSRKSYTYEQAQNEKSKNTDFGRMIEALNRIACKLKKERIDRGCLELSSNEIKINYRKKFYANSPTESSVQSEITPNGQSTRASKNLQSTPENTNSLTYHSLKNDDAYSLKIPDNVEHSQVGSNNYNSRNGVLNMPTVEGIEQKASFETNSLIEEFMLLANVTVAKAVFQNNHQAILRRHPKFADDSFIDLKEYLSNKNINLNYLTSKELNDSLKNIEEKELQQVIKKIVTRSMNQAVYFCASSQPIEEFLHYGLAFPIYTHFTSPIRRYADILVHRQLEDLFPKPDSHKNEPFSFEKKDQSAHSISDQIDMENLDLRILGAGMSTQAENTSNKTDKLQKNQSAHSISDQIDMEDLDLRILGAGMSTKTKDSDNFNDYKNTTKHVSYQNQPDCLKDPASKEPRNNISSSNQTTQTLDMEEVCRHINYRNRSAMLASLEIDKLFIYLYIKNKKHIETTGFITKIRKNGLVIHIKELGIEDTIILNDSYVFNEATNSFATASKTYSLYDNVSVGVFQNDDLFFLDRKFDIKLL